MTTVEKKRAAAAARWVEAGGFLPPKKRPRPAGSADPREKIDLGPPERANHGAGVADRPIYNHAGSMIGTGRRTVSPVDRLAASGSLTDDMVKAAERLRADWLEAAHGVRDVGRADAERVDVCRGPFNFGPADHQVEASRRLAAAKAFLSAFERPIVEEVVFDEIPLFLVAARRKMNQREVGGVLKAALARLAELYQDRRRAA